MQFKNVLQRIFYSNRKERHSTFYYSVTRILCQLDSPSASGCILRQNMLFTTGCISAIYDMQYLAAA